MSKIINGGLDQYDAEPFEQQQFGTAGVEGVNCSNVETPDFSVALRILNKINFISELHKTSLQV